MLEVLQENTLNITEIYKSVQGETHLFGLPTIFIRTAACNLRCSWCDTPYSFGRGTPVKISDIISEIKSSGLKHVCVTGGEPLLQKQIFSLLTNLCNEDYKVSLETGGSLDTSLVDERVITILDIKCPGSEMEKKNYWQNLEQLRDHDEVKFVLLHRADYDYAKDVMLRYELGKMKHPPLLSPVHGELNPQELVEWILEDGLNVRLNLQMHKYIWDPQKQGV
ncbi:MAG: radical SAM protein [Chlamydiota bacterium]